MRVYIAGKMRGLPLFNFPSFDEAARKGRQMGYDIVSPADLDRKLGFDETKDDDFYGNDMRRAIERDLDALLSCDAIALLPGWETSVGATAELAVARWAGLMVLDARDFNAIQLVTPRSV